MKVFVFGILSVAALAAVATEVKPQQPRHLPTRERFEKEVVNRATAGGLGNLQYHGGPVIHSAHVISIFWGPSWGTGGADNATANHIIAFFNQFGTTGEYNTITQYSDGSGYIHTTNLGNTAWFDPSTPPVPATDAAVQGEVQKYINAHGFDSSAIYEVFLPSSTYADDGSGNNSCGGPNLQFCAYHSNYNASQGNVKYASMPYPSCGGCQTAGFSTAQNFDHFSCHETREAVTDEDGNAWYDYVGYEADDKCAWSPTPYLKNGYGYQYEYSNANQACISTR